MGTRVFKMCWLKHNTANIAILVTFKYHLIQTWASWWYSGSSPILDWIYVSDDFTCSSGSNMFRYEF